MIMDPPRYSLFPVQLLLTLTDNVALVLRFCDALPEVRLAIHGCHLLFLFSVESETLRLGTAWNSMTPPILNYSDVGVGSRNYFSE